MWLKLRIRSEKLPKLARNSVRRLKFPRHIGNQCRWIHFRWDICDRKYYYCTYCARADITVAKVTRNNIASQKWPRLYGKMDALNSNMTSDFKPEVVVWSKLRMKKNAKINEKQRQTAKLFTSFRKSMSLNPFPVTDIQPEVELMHLLRMCRHYCHVWNKRHCTDSEFAWTLSRSSENDGQCAGLLARDVTRTLLLS